jgi:cytochrome c oxidase subunit II
MGRVRDAAARTARALATLGLALMLAPAAFAEEPQDWQIGMQPGVTPVRARIDNLHDYYLLPIMGVICLIVLSLLLWVILRYNARSHPTPSKTTHNPVIELIWTLVPALVLLVIAFPSFRLLYYVDHTHTADMTLKVYGHQWYWTYEYPDQGDLTFDSYLVPDDKLEPGQPRLLTADPAVVVPVGATIRILVTGTDVIHSWFVPAVGVQEYAVIGRNNESWMRIDKPGTYYGQCNQICGVNHPFMPIEIKAVSEDEFNAWLSAAKKKAEQERGGFRLAADAAR